MDDLFQELPYAVIKLNHKSEIIDQNQAAQAYLPYLGTTWLKSCLKPESPKPLSPASNANTGDECRFWVGSENRIFFAQVFCVAEHTDRLVLIGEEPDFHTLLPLSLERLFEDFPSEPDNVAERIATLIQAALTFERLDLLRVDPNQRKYVYAYSIGMDVSGVYRTAYRKIRETGLGWLLQQQKPHLVSDFSPGHYSFLEDPQLYASGFRSLLRVPIVFDYSIVGAILLASVNPGRFQVEQAWLINQIAKHVAHSFFHAGTLLQREYQTLANATLLQTVLAGIPPDKVEEFLLLYCIQLRQISQAERVGISLLDQAKGLRCCVVEAGKELARVRKWEPIQNSGVQEMLNSKSIVAFNLADPRYENVEGELIGSGFTAMLHAPIENEQGEIFALLTAVTSDERALSQALAGLFKAASEQLGLILAKAPLPIEGAPPKRNLTAALIPNGFQHIIGSSDVMKETIRQASVAAKYDFPILITGDTGTGKELFAKAIHESSSVAAGPFIVVNSAAIPPNLLESELFGYQEGAFTGGLRGGKKGKILLAHHGTLFLDEIGELSSELQAKLLRVLQEKEVEPLGSTKPIPVEVRIISATHRNLQHMVEAGEFRLDLFYRLNGIEIKLPPLREREKDVLELTEHILEYLAKSHGTPLKRLSAEAQEMFLHYAWPGNVRQLQNMINRLFVFVEGQLITTKDLPPEFVIPELSTDKENEKDKLERLLKEFNGNKTAMAFHLGITRTGLWKKLKRLGIQ